MSYLSVQTILYSKHTYWLKRVHKIFIHANDTIIRGHGLVIYVHYITFPMQETTVQEHHLLIPSQNNIPCTRYINPCARYDNPYSRNHNPLARNNNQSAWFNNSRKRNKNPRDWYNKTYARGNNPFFRYNYLSAQFKNLHELIGVFFCFINQRVK